MHRILRSRALLFALLALAVIAASSWHPWPA